jgi:hypothetical protein
LESYRFFIIEYVDVDNFGFFHWFYSLTFLSLSLTAFLYVCGKCYTSVYWSLFDGTTNHYSDNGRWVNIICIEYFFELVLYLCVWPWIHW